MVNNFFITGMPKSGKTTILKKLALELKQKKLKVGGFLSPEEKVHGTRTGFKVQDLGSKRCARLASIDCDGPRVAKYHVDIRSFESFLKQCMKTPSNFDVIFIDEIGRMEMKSTRFQDCLEKLLESSIPLIASLHSDYVEDYKVWGKILNVTPSSRERIHFEILNEVKNIQPAPPGKPDDELPFKPVKPDKSAVKSKSKKTKKQSAKKKKTSKAQKPKQKKIIKKKSAGKTTARKKASKKQVVELSAEKKPAQKPQKKSKEKKGLLGWLKSTLAS